ncbi:MAG: NDP-sugar synthase [Blastocatellia bacterium]|nr:NDP-sugar synthase [Blastocatellia bacterium]
MRAVIIATGIEPELVALNERHPAPLLPLGDRPWIQHILESLVERGVTEFDFVLHHLPEKMEQFLGNGARWGCVFRFHLARNAARPYGVLRTLQKNEPVLLGHADRYASLPAEMSPDGDRFYYHCDSETGVASWTGWAWMSPEMRASLPEDVDEGELEAMLQDGERAEVANLLRLRSYEDLLAAHAVLLKKAFPGVSLGAAEVEPGIWLGRNVSLPPTVRIKAPVYLGENCRIGEGSELGPNVMIAHNSILGARCVVANTVIFSGSYVGEALELRDVIVDKNLLINARLGAAIPVADDFILGSMAEPRLREGFGAIRSRLLAVAMLALVSPVLLLTALFLKLVRRGPVLYKHPFIKLPAPANEAQWRTAQRWSFTPEPNAGASRWSDLFLRVLPALVNIARGELRFVGVPPRPREEVRRLSHDWQALYLRAKAGIVTEADVQYGSQADEDERYSSEAFYSATASGWQDFRLMLGYLGGLVKSPGVATGEGQEWDAESEA